MSLLSSRPVDAIHARATYFWPGPVEHKPDPHDVTQNTFSRVDTLTDGALNLRHRQGKHRPGRESDRRDGPGEYLSPNDVL